MKKLSKKIIIPATIGLILLAALLIVAESWFGATELVQFNSRSIMDWSLGGRISGVESSEDARIFDDVHFEWFEDDFGSGVRNVSTNARYYLGRYPDTDLGVYCVTGFSSNERSYSVMGIRIGSDELEAKNILLDNHYRIKSGAYGRLIAVRGDVTIVFSFDHGKVSGIGAYLSPTNLFR